jgi:hypothetical protein
MRCSRCGSEGETQYGSDGLAYCNSCAFYGMNKQCYRCRMYLPASELQQYKGQWMCPYCLNDSRSEERKSEERVLGEGERGTGYASGERCERCGRELTTVYYYGGRKLCGDCLDDAKRDWKDTGGEKPPLPPYRVAEKAAAAGKKRSFMEWLFSELLILLRLRKRKKEPEIVSMRKPVRMRQGAGRPLERETAFEQPQEPIAEGPQSKEKGRQKKSQDVSFSSYAPQAKDEKTAKRKKDKKESFGGLKED